MSQKSGVFLVFVIALFTVTIGSPTTFQSAYAQSCDEIVISNDFDSRNTVSEQHPTKRVEFYRDFVEQDLPNQISKDRYIVEVLTIQNLYSQTTSLNEDLDITIHDKPDNIGTPEDILVHFTSDTQTKIPKNPILWEKYWLDRSPNPLGKIYIEEMREIGVKIKEMNIIFVYAIPCQPTTSDVLSENAPIIAGSTGAGAGVLGVTLKLLGLLGGVSKPTISVVASTSTIPIFPSIPDIITIDTEKYFIEVYSK